jgi:putative hemolysin
MQKKTMALIGIGIAMVILGIFALYNLFENNKIQSIKTYSACAAAGYPIQESYPEQCRTPDGRMFVNTITLPSMANPASVYCKDNGGTLEIKDEEKGQVGYCTLKSGKVCEEWQFFRGECK